MNQKQQNNETKFYISENFLRSFLKQTFYQHKEKL